jgi:hypothetical protein
MRIKRKKGGISEIISVHLAASRFRFNSTFTSYQYGATYFCRNATSLLERTQLHTDSVASPLIINYASNDSNLNAYMEVIKSGKLTDRINLFKSQLTDQLICFRNYLLWENNDA